MRYEGWEAHDLRDKLVQSDELLVEARRLLVSLAVSATPKWRADAEALVERIGEQQR